MKHTIDKKPARTYKDIELVDFPSGMGGVLPGAVAERFEAETQVICLHPEYYTNWLLTVSNEDIKPISYHLSEDMARIIDSRLRSQRGSA